MIVEAMLYCEMGAQEHEPAKTTSSPSQLTSSSFFSLWFSFVMLMMVLLFPIAWPISKLLDALLGALQQNGTNKRQGEGSG